MRSALLGFLLPAAAVLFFPAAGGAQDAPSSDDIDYEAMPEGPGKDEVFGICATCHSMKLVFQQRLSRERWKETLDWMVEEQGMAEFDDEMNDLLLSYLTAHYGPTNGESGAAP